MSEIIRSPILQGSLCLLNLVLALGGGRFMWINWAAVVLCGLSVLLWVLEPLPEWRERAEYDRLRKKFEGK